PSSSRRRRSSGSSRSRRMPRAAPTSSRGSDPVAAGPDGPIPPWPVLERVPLGDYRIFRVRKDVARSPRTGLPHDFYILEGGNWVNVVALTESREVVLVRQYRLGTASESLEIPGGCVEESDRDALHSAQRELLEETGYGG